MGGTETWFELCKFEEWFFKEIRVIYLGFHDNFERIFIDVVKKMFENYKKVEMTDFILEQICPRTYEMFDGFLLIEFSF